MISKYVCACVYTCTCAHVCVYMCVYEYVYVCKCVSTYVHMKSTAPGQNATCDFFMLDHGQLQRLIMVMPNGRKLLSLHHTGLTTSAMQSLEELLSRIQVPPGCPSCYAYLYSYTRFLHSEGYL